MDQDDETLAPTEPTQESPRTFDDASASDAPRRGYAVLARRYRPQRFDALIGQDFLVTVLTNAFKSGRIPHAMILTGVRGVGKTTTARIIAKGLNCAEADGPTIEPCGRCATCRAIAASRHVDVLEMDAASRTGIDDIREIIDGVAYRAAEARYKVYIIDETHMLSKNAFNGLLKTLEEPPEHVVFILATTDIEKVPVTVLSRCMRFDLRRVAPETLQTHMADICAREGADVEADALAVIARAAEGSVRDALSLLDQAVAHAGGGRLDAESARAMLGMADRGAIFGLMDAVMRGAAADALERLGALHDSGAEPAHLIRDLGEACHLATMIKASPSRASSQALTPVEREAATAAAERYDMRALGRLWQMVLKALEEIAIAPSPLSAAEMALIRMCHISELPPPDEILRRLEEGGSVSARAAREGGGANGSEPRARAVAGARPSVVPSPERSPSLDQERPAAGAQGVTLISGGGATARGLATPLKEAGRASALEERSRVPEPDFSASRDAPARLASLPPIGAFPGGGGASAPSGPSASASRASDAPSDFEAIVALIRKKRDGALLFDVERHIRPGAVRPGVFEFTPAGDAPPALAATLAKRLTEWTDVRWVVSVADGHDGETLEETRRAAADSLRAEALAHPLVAAALTIFPGAELSDVRRIDETPPLLAADEDDDALFDGPPPFDPYEDEI